MSMKHYRKPEDPAAALAVAAIEKARSAARVCAVGRTSLVGQHKAAVERAFSQMNKRPSWASSAASYLRGTLPRTVIADRGETTIALLYARVLEQAGINLEQQRRRRPADQEGGHGSQ